MKSRQPTRQTSRRSHDRGKGQAPLHLVSAFATTARLVLGQEAVADKSNEINAIPILLERLAEGGALKGAIVTIDAIACNDSRRHQGGWRRLSTRRERQSADLAP
jgi:hypothetical protein